MFFSWERAPAILCVRSLKTTPYNVYFLSLTKVKVLRSSINTKAQPQIEHGRSYKRSRAYKARTQATSTPGDYTR